ncbi:Elongation factor EFG, domain V-like [Dillenia turbinata]|uniref:Elongation factor EFG, domain V-like n=1 Tax=Dillenia turbinata TaxID=194707 RepID=A0AAN8YW18_9MAGN
MKAKTTAKPNATPPLLYVPNLRSHWSIQGPIHRMVQMPSIYDIQSLSPHQMPLCPTHLSRSKCSSPVPPNAPVSRQRLCECAVMLRMLRHRRDRPSSRSFPVMVKPLYNIKVYLPVIEWFGFSSTLRATSSGQAFAQCVFDHWDMMSSDPLENGTQAANLVANIRKRKGLKEQMTSLSEYEDKLLFSIILKLDPRKDYLLRKKFQLIVWFCEEKKRKINFFSVEANIFDMTKVGVATPSLEEWCKSDA